VDGGTVGLDANLILFGNGNAITRCVRSTTTSTTGNFLSADGSDLSGRIQTERKRVAIGICIGPVGHLGMDIHAVPRSKHLVCHILHPQQVL
jgi:hypothetical protein